MTNQSHPSSADAAVAERLSQQGVDLLADGKAVEAVNAFRRAIDLSSTCGEAHHGLIRALLDAHRPDEAVDAASRLVALAPTDPLAHTSLSIALQKAGRIAEAEAAAGKARIMEWKLELKGDEKQ